MLQLSGYALSCLMMVGMLACGGGETEDTGAMKSSADSRAVANDPWDPEELHNTFALTNHFEEWDANDDNMLNQEEFYNSLHSIWDTNNDGNIDESEWQAAAADFGMENETLSAWDTNGDGAVDQSELQAGLAQRNYFSAWDANGDNMISEREYTDRLMAMWDENDSGFLEDSEYSDRYYNYYGI